ncbi:ribitol-5-phosphate transferase FKTN, partial [Centroberyx affinis]|uniref:ribitol-5-phosphate transferase FKTN n=1 Tax=Centroberyx affinis TaxID=166261 RepID=UPI003A5C4BDE
MPRLNKTAILALLVATSSVFLLFQLYYYRQYVSKPGPHILTRTGQLTASDLQWQTVKKFLSLARRFDWPLFLADSASLGRLSQDALLRRDGQLREPHCSFLCTGRPIMSFALLANLWKYDATLLSAAEQKGFQLLQLRGKDPRLASLDDLSGEEIPLHFLFRLQGQVIQVVFLYERSGNYLWHGALRLKPDMDRSFTDFKKLDYGHHAGAYDRPELVLTTLDGLDIRIPRNISRFLSERSHARFSECRYRDARNFLQLYPDDSSPEAVDFRRRAKSLLRLAAQTLDRLSVPFWLSSGTCLGWFRQCSIIPYSRDVDIGILAGDFQPDIMSAFRSAGLPLKHKFGKLEDSLELSFQGDDVKLDVFFFYQEGDFLWNGGTQAKSGKKFKSKYCQTALEMSSLSVPPSHPGITACWAAARLLAAGS